MRPLVSGENGAPVDYWQEVWAAWTAPWKWYEIAMAVFLFFGVAFLVALLTSDFTPPIYTPQA